MSNNNPSLRARVLTASKNLIPHLSSLIPHPSSLIAPAFCSLLVSRLISLIIVVSRVSLVSSSSTSSCPTHYASYLRKSSASYAGM